MTSGFLGLPDPEPTAKPGADGQAKWGELVRRLASDLRAFRVDGVAQLLGPMAQAALGRGETLPGERALSAYAGEPLAVLSRLFLLGRPVTRAELDRALPTCRSEGAQRLALVRADGEDPSDEVRPLVDLTPYAADDDEWLLASDLTHGDGPLPTDHVLGVGGASTTLARWTPRTHVGTALDIGTGCGVQAVHLATHASAVTATDTEPRALAFAAFNAMLNAAVDDGPFAGRSLDLRRGSLLEPVAGQRFDLVVSNPPYVITPRTGGGPAYTYRDGGLEGDAVVRTLVEGLGSVLEPGGTAQLLGNWEHRRGESWTDRVGAWLDTSGLHGWVVQREVQDPAEYAETWARDGGHRPGSADQRALYAAWLDDFAARGVEAVGFGVVTLRRPAAGQGGARVRRLEEHRGPVAPALGAAVAGVMAAEQWLLEVTDDDLVGERFVTADDVTQEQHGRPGAVDPSVVLLRQGGALLRAVQVSSSVAAVVGACDGDLPLGVLVAAVAELSDEASESVAGRVLPAVRRLVADGFLAPSAGA